MRLSPVASALAAGSLLWLSGIATGFVIANFAIGLDFDKTKARQQQYGYCEKEKPKAKAVKPNRVTS